MILRTEHGENIANQIQVEDAYGDFDILTAADLWNILDQFQTHLIDKDCDNKLISKLNLWMREIEDEYSEIQLYE